VCCDPRPAGTVLTFLYGALRYEPLRRPWRSASPFVSGARPGDSAKAECPLMSCIGRGITKCGGNYGR